MNRKQAKSTSAATIWSVFAQAKGHDSYEFLQSLAFCLLSGRKQDKPLPSVVCAQKIYQILPNRFTLHRIFPTFHCKNIASPIEKQ